MDRRGSETGRRSWEPMTLEYVGHVAEILHGGDPGKDSTSTGDPGDSLKVPSTDK